MFSLGWAERPLKPFVNKDTGKGSSSFQHMFTPISEMPKKHFVVWLGLVNLELLIYGSLSLEGMFQP